MWVGPMALQPLAVELCGLIWSCLCFVLVCGKVRKPSGLRREPTRKGRNTIVRRSPCNKLHVGWKRNSQEESFIKASDQVALKNLYIFTRSRLLSTKTKHVNVGHSHGHPESREAEEVAGAIEWQIYVPTRRDEKVKSEMWKAGSELSLSQDDGEEASQPSGQKKTPGSGKKKRSAKSPSEKKTAAEKTPEKTAAEAAAELVTTSSKKKQREKAYTEKLEARIGRREESANKKVRRELIGQVGNGGKHILKSKLNPCHWQAARKEAAAKEAEDAETNERNVSKNAQVKCMVMGIFWDMGAEKEKRFKDQNWPKCCPKQQDAEYNMNDPEVLCILVDKFAEKTRGRATKGIAILAKKGSPIVLREVTRCECFLAMNRVVGCGVWVTPPATLCYECRQPGWDGEPRYCSCQCSECEGVGHVSEFFPSKIGAKTIIGFTTQERNPAK